MTGYEVIDYVAELTVPLTDTILECIKRPHFGEFQRYCDMGYLPLHLIINGCDVRAWLQTETGQISIPDLSERIDAEELWSHLKILLGLYDNQVQSECESESICPIRTSIANIRIEVDPITKNMWNAITCEGAILYHVPEATALVTLGVTCIFCKGGSVGAYQICGGKLPWEKVRDCVVEYINRIKQYTDINGSTQSAVAPKQQTAVVFNHKEQHAVCNHATITKIQKMMQLDKMN